MANSTSTKSLPQGVRVRGESIQITFRSRGRDYSITLPYTATAKNIQAASKVRTELITKAKWGILTEQDIAEAKGIQSNSEVVLVSGILFQEVAQLYIRHCDANLDTRRGYLRILNYHWIPHLALVPVQNISSDMIKEIILSIGFKTAKTLNNALIPLRGVFNTAVEKNIIASNPLDRIKNKKVQIDLPDPFTRNEMNTLLNWLRDHLIGQNVFYYWFYEFAFWSGCRPSEIIALRWADIDWFNDTVRINKSRVRGIEKQVTKTHTVREVHLNDRSKRALIEIQKIGLSDDYIALCPETLAPFQDERPPRLRLIEAMKACKIRHRPAYNARHTYATMLLMAGVNPAFVANQLGHSLQMLMKRYARWIHGDQSKVEMAKLNTN